MILSFKFLSSSAYFAKRIENIADFSDIKVKISYKKPYILVWTDEKNKNFEKFTLNLDKYLYNSVFLKGLKFKEGEIKGDSFDKFAFSLSPCQKCIEEMLKEGRRFYYPFTSCGSCGNQRAFLNRYPFKRENSTLSVFRVCEKCQKEIEENPFRKNYPLISCINCAVPIRVEGKNRVFWANEGDDYKRAFEIISKAILDGKKVLVKTLLGYKRFYKDPLKSSFVLAFNENISKSFMLLAKEKKALFSIEKPMLFLTSSKEEIREKISAVVSVIAPFDTFTTLLANELKNDLDYIFFDEERDFDIKLDFDLPIHKISFSRYFINRNYEFFKDGDFALFSKAIFKDGFAFKNWACRDGILDKRDKFEGEFKEIENPFEKSVLSVIRENGIENEKSVGVYFGKRWKFYLYDGKIREFFDFGDVLISKESLESLREGSFKLVKNFSKKFGRDFERFLQKEDLFEKVCALLGEEGGFERLNVLAMEFGGKGGVSIDCFLKDKKFDFNAFFASIMSYKIADSSNSLIAYSVFESLGDFLSNQAVSVKRKFNAKHLALCGEYIANSAFFSRFLRNAREVKVNIEYPATLQNVFLGI